MANKKHDYIIEINELKEPYDTYTYKYGQISGIVLKISKDGIKIEMKIGKLYTIDDILSYNRYFFFSDAIKKALLLHLIRYSEELSIEMITVSIDGTEDLIDPKEKRIVFSLIDSNLIRPVKSQGFLEPSVTESLLKLSKSKQENRVASLYALLYSKSKVYEAERFVYLWMSFNGLYGYVGNLAASRVIPQKKGNPVRIGDREGIAHILAVYGLTHERELQNDSKEIARDVIRVLENWNGKPVTRESLESGEHKDLRDAIEPLLKTRRDKSGKLAPEKQQPINMTVYGYLLGFFSYYFRCNFIHAAKPLPLYSYEAEYELRCLRLVNQLLEDFLDENLWKYFDPKREDEVVDRLKVICNDTSYRLR